jgi:hypothetical protein
LLKPRAILWFLASGETPPVSFAFQIACKSLLPHGLEGEDWLLAARHSFCAQLPPVRRRTDLDASIAAAGEKLLALHERAKASAAQIKC